MKMLAIYDIANPRRLNKIAKILKDYGIRVQYSKFEIDPAGENGFTILQERIMAVIDPQADGVKFIPLCHSCRNKIEIIGQGRYIDPDEEFYII